MTDFLHILKIELDLLVLKDYLSGLLLIRCGVPQSPILDFCYFVSTNIICIMQLNTARSVILQTKPSL